MIHSAEFLATLDHSNPDRPRFTIKPSSYTMLDIVFEGQRLAVPLAEILEFARRLQHDIDARTLREQQAGRLGIYPYPIMSVGVDDPDCRDVGWD